MIHYGEDLKEKLRLGLVKDLEAATHHIAGSWTGRLCVRASGTQTEDIFSSWF